MTTKDKIRIFSLFEGESLDTEMFLKSHFTSLIQTHIAIIMITKMQATMGLAIKALCFSQLP
jgi:hypothetical protein